MKRPSAFLAAFALVFVSIAASATEPTAIVPKHDLRFWGRDNPNYQDNNCYNYATNRATNNFAQPGQTADAYIKQMACKEVMESVAKDGGLVPTEFFEFKGKEDDMLVALVVWPKRDFHWYRRDDDNYWTHKMGNLPATDKDHGGDLITNPETADRGPYSEFCGYYRVKNYKYAKHEQNGGYVKIGDMKEFPLLPGESGGHFQANIPNALKEKKASTLQLQRFSGRTNPELELKQILAEPEMRSQLVALKGEIEAAAKRPATETTIYSPGGLSIDDRDGLLFGKGSRVEIRGREVTVHAKGEAAYSLTLGKSLPMEAELTKAAAQ